MIGNINSLRRQVKNVAYNFSDAQVKVREATSNDPWGPSSSLMSEIADMTYNTMAFAEIMQMIWKRLNDHGKNWRHVYKGLVLLDYLIKVGSERVAQQCRENIYSIQTLRDFQHVEENKDQGMNVREKAKQLVNLLKDDERLKNERARALMARKRFVQNGMGMGSDGSSFRRSDTYYADDDYDQAGAYNIEGVSARTRRNGMRRGVSVPNIPSELEECRPGSAGEEELQLQIALALSKEEAQKEEEQRKHDDLRLQLALSESRHTNEDNSIGSQPSPPVNFTGPAQNKTSAIDDLLSLQPTFEGNANDPFATPRGASAMPVDPWGASFSNTASASASVDPWGTSVTPQPVSQGGPNFLLDSQYPHIGGTNLQNQGGFSNTDPWSMDTIRSGLPEENQNDLLSSIPSTMSKNRTATKTPEHFLGENSALVNLDNLMGPAKPVFPGMPLKTSTTNPFGGGSTFSTGSALTPNPFVAPARPSPTMNEMRQTNVQQPTGTWQSQQPTNISPTNPFL